MDRIKYRLNIRLNTQKCDSQENNNTELCSKNTHYIYLNTLKHLNRIKI